MRTTEARPPRLFHLTVLLLGLMLLGACQGDYPQSSIDPRTDFAETIHSLYVQVTLWTLAILVVVWGALAYVLIRFREDEKRPAPEQTHGHLGMEIAWTIVPAIIVVAIAIPTIRAVFETQTELEGDPLIVEIIGHRYWWEVRYPESGVTTANEIHLPAGRPVTLQMSSADVIHSFWVPQLGGKRDVNPLRRVGAEGEVRGYTYLYFTVREPGVFLGQCAEFCGQGHSLMRMRVVAESESDFNAWLADWQEPSATATAPPTPQDTTVQTPAEDPLVALGRQTLFSSTCFLCHSIEGTRAVGALGPNLTRIGGRMTIGAGLLENTPENLFRWIKAPASVKPGVQMPGAQEGGGGFPPTNLTDDQVRAVAAYLSSLR